MTTARLRPTAEADLIHRTQYYRREGGDALGKRFFDTAIAALRTIEEMPGSGSQRLAEVCHIQGLRFSRVAGFPCGWFYLIRVDHVDVLRVLADDEDLPNILATSDHHD